MQIAYVLLVLLVILVVIIDRHQARKDRKDQVWKELKRTDYKRRRPAAK